MEIKEIDYGSDLYNAAKACREQVLREPLGLMLSAEDVADEDRQIHIVVFDDDSVWATVILKPLDEARMKLRQMAVTPDQQGKGLGARLVQAAEDVVRGRGCKVIELHARMTAKGFYEKMGYRAVGDEFIEVTELHICMEKKLA